MRGAGVSTGSTERCDHFLTQDKNCGPALRSNRSHTNGIESFWSLLKRAHKGRFHKMSPKHLQRYVTEFARKHNVRAEDTETQMTALTHGLIGKRLTYRNLIAPNGLPSGARS